MYSDISDDYTNFTEIISDDTNAPDEDAIKLNNININWEGLKASNPDTVGWVYIPNTPVNYPIVWRENDDNYYMHRDFYDQMSGIFGAQYGCIGLTGINKPDMSDEINTLYGHHMNNGSMFAVFQSWLDQNEFNQINIGYVFTPERTFVLKPICVDKISGNAANVVINGFQDTNTKDKYLNNMINIAYAKADNIDVGSINKIFSMYTCSEPDNQNRIFVFWNVVDDIANSETDIDETTELIIDEATTERIQ